LFEGRRRLLHASNSTNLSTLIAYESHADTPSIQANQTWIAAINVRILRRPSIIREDSAPLPIVLISAVVSGVVVVGLAVGLYVYGYWSEPRYQPVNTAMIKIKI